MSLTLRIKDCLDNYEKYVVFMASMPDNELAKKLELVHLQMELAEKNKNTQSLELLEIWRKQIIEARIYKAENCIEDVPGEIEHFFAEMEIMENKSEERAKTLHKPVTTTKTAQINGLTLEVHKSPDSQADSDEQLKLF